MYKIWNQTNKDLNIEQKKNNKILIFEHGDFVKNDIKLVDC